MDNTIDYKHYLYRYVEGTMDQREKLWFEKELESDTALRTEVEMHQRINNIISQSETLELHKKLNAIYDNLDEQKPTRNLYRTIYYSGGVAASFAFGILFFKGGQVDPTLLAEKFYQQPDHFTILRSADKVNVDVSEALSFYNRKQYAEAILLMNKVLEHQPELNGLHLYLGISHYELKEYSTAIKSFDRIIEQKQDPFINTAEWYKGLSYLNLNQTQPALEIFSDLAHENTFYSKDAKKIIKKLK